MPSQFRELTLREALQMIKAHQKREHEAWRRQGFLAVQFTRIMGGKKARRLTLDKLILPWDDLGKSPEQLKKERTARAKQEVADYEQRFNQ